jgi:hypothetical protein
MRPSQPLIQWVKECFPTCKPRPGRDANHSPHLTPTSRKNRSYNPRPLGACMEVAGQLCFWKQYMLHANYYLWLNGGAVKTFGNQWYMATVRVVSSCRMYITNTTGIRRSQWAGLPSRLSQSTLCQMSSRIGHRNSGPPLPWQHPHKLLPRNGTGSRGRAFSTQTREIRAKFQNANLEMGES